MPPLKTRKHFSVAGFLAFLPKTERVVTWAICQRVRGITNANIPSNERLMAGAFKEHGRYSKNA